MDFLTERKKKGNELALFESLATGKYVSYAVDLQPWHVTKQESTDLKSASRPVRPCC